MNNQKKQTSREEQSLRRRRELIDAALRVFAEKGFAGSSIVDVGKAAGVSPGLIYHYFDSKEAMLN
jgi:AcrR family transcriptional regulator